MNQVIMENNTDSIKHESELNLATFYFDLYSSGIEIGQKNISFIRKLGFLDDIPNFEKKAKVVSVKIDESLHSSNQEESSESKINNLVKEIICPKQEADDAKNVIVTEPVEEKKKLINLTITKNDWLPHNGKIWEPDIEFVELIDSILKGYSHRSQFKKFELYKQQAMNWVAENKRFSDYDEYDEQFQFVREERNKIRENSLYYVLKYLVVKDAQSNGGERIINPYDCQAFVCYLIDCGFSMIIGKLRQVGFSTIIGAVLEIKTQLSKSFFAKFITERGTKGMEIFEDKIKFPLYRQPAWLKPTVSNENIRELQFMAKPTKGTAIVGGKLLVEAPYVTAINGGSPDIVAIDEAGNVGILRNMISQGRPTMFRLNNEGVMEVVRQIIIWGTGGNLDKGGGAFEAEFRSAMKAWANRDFRYGIIPIFIDAFAKPGITKEFYEQELRAAETRAIEDPMNSETIMVEFRQTYPVTVDDMFLRSNKTIVPIDVINKHISRIYDRTNNIRYGHFIPIFDNNFKTQNKDYPHRIVGAQFIETGFGSDEASAAIIIPPEQHWVNRYFKGTDPINSESGQSNFSSAIWDSYLNGVAAITNHRTSDYKYCYLQSLLLGIYYDKKIKDLLEYNIGSGYVDFIEPHGYKYQLVYNKMLPKYMQVGTVQYGISKKGFNAVHISNKLIELLSAYQNNIDCEEFWLQLKNYVQKIKPQTGYAKYAPANPAFHRDDVIDSVTYSYINALIHSKNEPEYLLAPKKQQKIKRRFGYDQNWNIILTKK